MEGSVRAIRVVTPPQAFDVKFLNWFARLNKVKRYVAITATLITLYATVIVKRSLMPLWITVKQRNQRLEYTPSLTKSMLRVSFGACTTGRGTRGTAVSRSDAARQVLPGGSGAIQRLPANAIAAPNATPIITPTAPSGGPRI